MDHNLGTGDSQITKEEFAKVVEASSLCLAISEPMARLYSEMFGNPVYFVPPVVDEKFAQLDPLPAPVSGECRGVMIGNIWSERWLDLLLDVLAGAHLPLTIYGTATPPHIDSSRLASIGELKGFVPEAELVADLRKRPYAIVPCGSLDERDDLAHVGSLSLPSRIPYMAAVANLPLIVLGSRSSAAASFAVDNDIGLVVPYNAEALREAVADICRPERQAQFRESAARLAGKLCTADMAGWLLASLDLGKPVTDLRSWNDQKEVRKAIDSES
jgi:glycosyltransferase involved in cell wall biosynthesis